MSICLNAQNYPQNYFRSPLDIPMSLVANFGEIRANHWHMGLDIRTNHKVNLPVYAAADGYIARVSVEPSGFGQAIYINHPNGYTTLYGHLNSFFSELNQYVKDQQYGQESWRINLTFPPGKFPVKKGQLIALSGSTGASEGPHVHFEIRDTKTEKVLNPLLFKFPIADNVPPTISRLAMYDRNKSTYFQSPQFLDIKKTKGNTIRVGSDKISFAVGATDRFTGSTNPNGIFNAKVIVDANAVSGFVLDRIGYDETRYINAQIDYPYHQRGGPFLQHITPLPGARTIAYNMFGADGIIYLKDRDTHSVLIDVQDANGNSSQLMFNIRYDPTISTPMNLVTSEKFLPNNVNIFERTDFAVHTTEASIYDTLAVSYSSTDTHSNAISLQHNFLNGSIPSHDFITVRIKPTVTLTAAQKDRVIIKSTIGAKSTVVKAEWQKDWMVAKFRQFGGFQAFVDDEPPTVNAVAANLSKAKSIALVPKDNFNSIKSFRAELDGNWLRFTNDKGRTWIYNFDEHFPAGEHELKVIIEDEAGNVMTKVWKVKR